MIRLLAALAALQAPATIVSPAGPLTTIAAGLAAAPPHGRLLVRAGVYREPTIQVRRPVEIVGEPGAVIDGEGERQLLRITADSVTVRGLRFRRVGSSSTEDRAAIRAEQVRDCLIEDNTVDDGFFGIYLARVVGCRVLRNRLQAGRKSETVSGNGIHLWSADSVLIAGNQVGGYRDGIYFEFVHHGEIRNNRSEHNLRYGLHFMYSDNCRYQENIFRANGSGVAVMFTSGVEMVDNQFLDAWGAGSYGLLLKEMTDSRLTGNRFAGNTVGLVAEGATRLEARGNEFENNGRGIELTASSQEARFVGNTFVGNTFDVTTNSSNTRADFSGNFWDEYRGYDLDRNGLGDVPFHPVRLFSLVTEHNPPALLLLRSLFVHLLDVAERAIPSLTPETIVDPSPAMRRPPSRAPRDGTDD
jgi:nitrous oxidase accessory protein